MVRRKAIPKQKTKRRRDDPSEGPENHLPSPTKKRSASTSVSTSPVFIIQHIPLCEKHVLVRNFGPVSRDCYQGTYHSNMLLPTYRINVVATDGY